MADEPFRPGALSDIQAYIQKKEPAQICFEPTVARARALVHLSIAELASQRKSPLEVEEEAAEAQQDVRYSLQINPTDSFLWLMLYSTQIARVGFDADHLRYIDQSYATGAYEGWVTLRRNRVTLAVFPILSDAEQVTVLREFAAIVDSGFVEQAAKILTSVGWQQRERLLASLGQVDIGSREGFAKYLRRDGVTVDVPGVYVDERWWR